MCQVEGVLYSLRNLEKALFAGGGVSDDVGLLLAAESAKEQREAVEAAATLAFDQGQHPECSVPGLAPATGTAGTLAWSSCLTKVQDRLLGADSTEVVHRYWAGLRAAEFGTANGQLYGELRKSIRLLASPTTATALRRGDAGCLAIYTRVACANPAEVPGTGDPSNECYTSPPQPLPSILLKNVPAAVGTVRMPMVGFGTGCARVSEDRAELWPGLSPTEVDETVSSLFASAIADGYRLFDTAELYQNEQLLGTAIAASGVPRAEFFIITKLDDSKLPVAADEVPGHVRATVRAQLARLQTDYLDGYMLHHIAPTISAAHGPAIKAAIVTIVQLQSEGTAATARLNSQVALLFFIRSNTEYGRRFPRQRRVLAELCAHQIASSTNACALMCGCVCGWVCGSV